jgi:hypothetical protein
MSIDIKNDPEFILKDKSTLTNIGKMYLKHRDVRTFNGFEKSLIISALQKYIRRGLFNKAAWCVMELDYFKNLYRPDVMEEYLEMYPDREEARTLTMVKGIQTNTINRLRVICVEDIGIAQPGICVEVDKLIKQWEESGRMNSNFLIEIVRILCSSKKLRFLSDLKSVYHLPKYYGSKPDEELRILDFIVRLRNYYNIPQPAGEENINTDDISIFYWLSNNIDKMLEPKGNRKKAAIWNVLDKKCPSIYRDEIQVLKNWFIEGKPEAETPLYLYQAILLTILKDLPKKVVPLKLITLPYPSDINTYYTIKKIDDYCNDKHVKASGETSVSRFAQEGALVVNEATDLLDQRYRNLYIHLNKIIL